MLFSEFRRRFGASENVGDPAIRVMKNHREQTTTVSVNAKDFLNMISEIVGESIDGFERLTIRNPMNNYTFDYVSIRAYDLRQQSKESNLTITIERNLPTE